MSNSKDNAPVVILVAEDETLVRLVANDMLTDADYRVVEAHDGQEALSILSEQNTVRAIFTDVNMPHVDGIALARIVRERLAPHRRGDNLREAPAVRPAGRRSLCK